SLSEKLWSTRRSSSRQFVGSVGAANHWFAPMFGVGIIASSALTVTGSEIGTWLPGNGRPVEGSIGQLVPGQTSLKLPPRSAIVGTVVDVKNAVAGTLSRRHS